MNAVGISGLRAAAIPASVDKTLTVFAALGEYFNKSVDIFLASFVPPSFDDTRIYPLQLYLHLYRLLHHQ